MPINLIDVATYFKNLPHQQAALSYLQNVISDDNLEEFAKIWRTPLEDSLPSIVDKIDPDKDGDFVLDVPYFTQVDNYTQPDRTCNSSANAMCLKYFLPNSIKDDDEYLAKVLTYGDTTDHEAQTQALSSYGLRSEFKYDLNFSDLDSQLSKGNPIEIGILHRGSDDSPTGGHMIVIIGKYNGGYYVHDPYGDINTYYQTPAEDGKKARYSTATLKARWQVGSTNNGWGRVFYPSTPQPVVQKNQILPTAKPTNISQNGINIIKESEGLVLHSYPDPGTGGEPFTIGYGSCTIYGKPILGLGITITQEQAEKYLEWDLNNTFIPAILKLVKVPINQNQLDALCSFVYNVGDGAFADSTLLRKLNNKDYQGAAEEFSRWVKGGSGPLPGLVTRREKEKKLFLS